MSWRERAWPPERSGVAIRERGCELEGTGISLTCSADDMMLLVDYTVWQYQNRDSAGAMPDWLRLRRRERWLREKRTGGGAG